MRGLGLLEPAEIRQIGAGNQPRIVDLEPAGQEVIDENPRWPIVQLLDFQHHYKALVLCGLRDIGLSPIEPVIGSLNGEALASRRQRVRWCGNRRDDCLNGILAGIGDGDWIVQPVLPR